MARKPEPVGVVELKDAILILMATRFGNRPLTCETVEEATALVNFEVKQLAVFAPRK